MWGLALQWQAGLLISISASGVRVGAPAHEPHMYA